MTLPVKLSGPGVLFYGKNLTYLFDFFDDFRFSLFSWVSVSLEFIHFTNFSNLLIVSNTASVPHSFLPFFFFFFSNIYDWDQCHYFNKQITPLGEKRELKKIFFNLALIRYMVGVLTLSSISLHFLFLIPLLSLLLKKFIYLFGCIGS